MNEWLKKQTQKGKELWAKGSIVQKIVLFAVIAAVVVAIILALAVPSRSTAVRVFDSPVEDAVWRERIMTRINRDNISAHADNDGYIYIDDKDKLRIVREMLIGEGIVPGNIDPWEGYYNRNWSTTDKEQNDRRKQAIQTTLRQHIESIPDIMSANIQLTIPDDNLFADSQNPVKASVILTAAPMSSILENISQIRGIQNLILSAVEGLKEENITITDIEGNIINNFKGMEEMDRLSQTERFHKYTQKLEAEYRAKIIKGLEKVLTSDRIGDLNIKIKMDGSKRISDAEIYTPITIKEDNPNTPYDDSEYKDSLTISSQTVTREWQGTGFNPEGPAGVEGQTPPVYSDMSNVIGRETQTGVTQNNVVNKEVRHTDQMPVIEGVTASLMVDGKWEKPLDPKTHKFVIDEETGGIKRTYVPLSKEDKEKLRLVIEKAIGSDGSRNYSVEVADMQFDRSKEFAREDVEYFKAISRNRTILLSLAVVALILGGFVIFRIINREMERRRREREEELLRKQQAAREQALWDAKDDGMEVTMSVEESHRAELQENAIAMAKAHPEDVAMLIRTWLAEE